MENSKNWTLQKKLKIYLDNLKLNKSNLQQRKKTQLFKFLKSFYKLHKCNKQKNNRKFKHYRNRQQSH